MNISDADLSALVELLREAGITEAMQRVTSTAPVTVTEPKARGTKAGTKRGKYNTKHRQAILDRLTRTEQVVKNARLTIKEATELLNEAREANQDFLIKARKAGIPVADIANALGISEGSVTSRYQTARKQARKRTTTK